MEDILKIAAMLCGASEGDELLQMLCQAASDVLTLRLRDGVTVEECGKAFIIAAAAMGAKAWEEGTGPGGISSFAAGSVSLSVSQEGDRFVSAALGMLEPWLKDAHFGFRRV